MGGGGWGGGRVRETYFKLTTYTYSYYMLMSAMNMVHYSDCQVVCGVLIS